MSEFISVPHDLRRTISSRGSRANDALYEALERGETAFVPLNGRPSKGIQSASYRAMQRRGFLVRSYQRTWDDQQGLVMWAEPIEGPA